MKNPAGNKSIQNTLIWILASYKTKETAPWSYIYIKGNQSKLFGQKIRQSHAKIYPRLPSDHDCSFEALRDQGGCYS